jgi:hypothetical protein
MKFTIIFLVMHVRYLYSISEYAIIFFFLRSFPLRQTSDINLDGETLRGGGGGRHI